MEEVLAPIKDDLLALDLAFFALVFDTFLVELVCNNLCLAVGDGLVGVPVVVLSEADFFEGEDLGESVFFSLPLSEEEEFAPFCVHIFFAIFSDDGVFSAPCKSVGGREVFCVTRG